MKPVLHLDFLHPAPPRGSLALVLALLAAAAVSACAWATWHSSAEADRLGAAIADARHESALERPRSRGAVLVDAKRLGEDVAEANGVIGRLATPWTRLFAGLEKAADPTVTLVGLQPDSDGRRLRIAGVARRFKDVLDYVGRLQDSPGLANVFLTSHESHEDPSGVSIAFSVSAEWRDTP